MATTRSDLPTVDTDSQVYWDAYREKRFLIAKCGVCDRVHHYPRPICPFCWSDDVSPVDSISERLPIEPWH